MISDSEEYLFFHEQRNISRHFKRFRKEPEELPQALRYFKYANLNPRIAAFLGKQDPKHLLRRNKQQGAKQDDKENVEIQRTMDGSKINDTLGMLGGFGEGLSQEARSLLPEIGPGMSLMKMGMMDDSLGPSRLSFNETDDPQRYHFEETTFAAPNILRELSDTLTRFEHAFREYRKKSRPQDAVGSTVPSPGPKQIDFFSSGVKHVLAQEWDDMISETIYTPRQWQSQAYKSGYKYSPTLASGRQIMTASATDEKYPGAKGDLKGMVDLLDGAHSKVVGKSATISETPILNAQLKKKPKLSEKILAKTLVAFKIDADRLHGRHGGNPTLSFNLSSKKAFDEGWVVNTLADQDIEKKNILEWATSRLQMVMKQKEDDEDSARKRGCVKATVIRYYGDSRRDTLMKLYRKNKENESQSKKSVRAMPKIPQLNKGDSDRDRFMVQLPDGSITLYYPSSGEVAVMASAVPNKPGQLYVHCYDNDDDRTSLAVFTPYGKSCCYHKNGIPGLVLSEQGGVLKGEDGSIVNKFVWPKYGKLRENVVFHLNKEMYVRVSNFDSVTLHFSCSRESMKIQVGAVAGVETPTNMSADNLGILQSGIRMSSKSAQDYSGQLKIAKEDKQKQLNKMRRNMFAFRKQNKKSSEIEELKKSLIPPERFEFESQADRELLRLQHKTKHLVEDWMEHYRSAIGMIPPALQKMLDKHEVRTAKRRIRSAVERKSSTFGQDSEEAAEDYIFGSTKFQSFRSPSAPPKHMASLLRPHFSSFSDNESKTKEGESHLAHSQSPHVRIDESQKEPRQPTAADAPNRMFKSTSGMESTSRQTHGRISQLYFQQKARSPFMVSSMHSNQTHSAGDEDRTTSEKVWSPPIEACPVTTRMRLLKPESSKKFPCKCSKHHIPHIHDVELDCFIREMVPSKQLIVVTVINSLHIDSNPYNDMLENLYITKNRNRTNPCMQSRHDQYRLLRYDLARAHVGTNQARPLLLQRHCAVPGMTLMYCSGRLLFADHIFNGYGNARKDFRKQIFKSRQDFHMGLFLPDDFRFTPSRGRPGPRAAWGGEIGGTGVECKGKPGLLPGHKSVPAKKLTTAIAFSYPTSGVRVIKSASYKSSLTDLSDHPVQSRAKSRFDSSRDFVCFSLSTKMYVQSKKTTSRANVRPTRNDSSLVQVARHVDADSSLTQLNSFLRMQTVK